MHDRPSAMIMMLLRGLLALLLHHSLPRVLVGESSPATSQHEGDVDMMMMMMLGMMMEEVAAEPGAAAGFGVHAAEEGERHASDAAAADDGVVQADDGVGVGVRMRVRMRVGDGEREREREDGGGEAGGGDEVRDP